MCTGPNQPPEPEQTPYVVSADLFRGKAQDAIKIKERVKVKASGWTLKEVQHHKLVVIKRKVYDIAGFDHPGGTVIYSYAGRDATDVFSAFHDPGTFSRLKDLYVGDLREGEKDDAATFGVVEDFRRLRTEFLAEGLFRASPLYYFWKVSSTLAILALSLILLIRGAVGSAVQFLASASLMGLFLQQCGWLAHDFCHNEVFKSRKLNQAFGYVLGNVLQGFSVSWWKTKHNRHHAVPNALDDSHDALDEDIDTLPLLAWDARILSTLSPGYLKSPIYQAFLRLQHVLIFPILTFARFMWSYGSLTTAVEGVNMKAAERAVERAGLAIHYAWFIGAPLYALGPLGALAFTSVAQMVAGGLLSYVFIQSHNGMDVYETHEKDFYSAQVVSTRDVVPGFLKFNDWFTGGLNYQLEHHLFPCMPRHNLHKIQPRVRAVIERHGLNFECVSMNEAVRRVCVRLRAVGEEATTVKAD